jgi:hypothetical protein
MRRLVVAGIVAVALTLTACASAGSADPPAAPSSEAPSAPPAPATPSSDAPDVSAALAAMPTPSRTGPVIAVGMLLDDGTPMLCRGVAESIPPKCGGPEVVGWDWSSVPFEEAYGVRWADDIALEVAYDVESFSITPTGPPLDLAALTLPAREIPAGDPPDADIAAIELDLGELGRADIMGGGGENGTYAIDVVYDDGSMQAAFDELYGAGAVHVHSWFVG